MGTSSTLGTAVTGEFLARWVGSLPNGSSAWYRYLDFNWEGVPHSTTMYDSTYLFVAFGMPSETGESMTNFQATMRHLTTFGFSVPC